MQSQIKVGEYVRIYGFALISEKDGSFGLFEGEEGIVREISGSMVVVKLKEKDDIAAQAQVHFFQVVPLNFGSLF